MAVVFVNDRIASDRDAVVSVFDHGFLYGEGVYEVMRTYGRAPFLYDRHACRLRESAARIALPVPFTDDDLLGRVRQTIDAAPDLDEAYVRILLTRGVGELTYDPRACPTPTLVIIVKAHAAPPAAVYEQGVRVTRVDVTRNHPQSVSPLIKSNNLLNNALAMQQAIARGAFEALMKNYRGEICECAQSNVFLVRDGVLATPPLDAGLLAGVTRGFVLGLADSSGIAARETTLRDEDVDAADEMFLTSTTREIVPVVSVDGRPVGAGVPGPVTRRLQAAFSAETAKLATPAAG
jgi:branched-chain amino acid aminotransferase